MTTTATCTISSDDSTWYTWADSTATTSVEKSTWTSWTSAASTTSTMPETTTYTDDGGTVWVQWVGELTIETSVEEPDRYDISHREVEEESDYKKREKEREIAEDVAKELLLDLIGKKELKVYEETGRLFVKGKKFDYIVQKDSFVQKIEKDKITDLCVHLDNKYKFPDTDNVVAMKLLLETDEDIILDLANEHGSDDRPEKLPLAACM